MVIEVRWSALASDDRRWAWRRVLYCYAHPQLAEVLYLGKADGRSVRERWRRSGKHQVWAHLESLGIHQHRAFVGEMHLEEGRRLSRELLADVESLLIKRLQPCANFQCLKTRIGRPGMVVRCVGDWPLARRAFHDLG